MGVSISTMLGFALWQGRLSRSDGRIVSRNLLFLSPTEYLDECVYNSEMRVSLAVFSTMSTS